jgi:hypothetical protein
MPIEYVTIPLRLRSFACEISRARGVQPRYFLINPVKEHGIGSGQIIRRKDDGSLEYHRDDLTIEEPLEIRARRERREKHALRSHRSFVPRMLAPRAHHLTKTRSVTEERGPISPPRPNTKIIRLSLALTLSF